MKSKCSFTLKALTSLVLAVVILFGTVSASIAATVQPEPVTAQDEPVSAGTPFRAVDGTTKIVIYYDDTYSKLRELDGFEDLYFVIIGDTYYRGYKMADLRQDNKFVAFINESYDDAKMFFVMAVDKNWTGESSEAVGAPFDQNVRELPGVIGCTDTYADEFVFETTNARMGHAYLLNTSADAALTVIANDIGLCPQEVVIPAADAEDEPDAPTDAEDLAEIIEDSAPADDAAGEQPVRAKKDSVLADTGAGADLAETGAETIILYYQKDMPSGNYSASSSSNMTVSSRNTNKYYTSVNLVASSSYGYYVKWGNDYYKVNATASSNQEVELSNYGSSNYGNSSDRVTYTTGSATSYVFTFDIDNKKICVSPKTSETVKVAWSVASDHDGDYNLGTYSNMTHTSDGVYTVDVNITTAAKHYMFIQTGGDRYHKNTSTLSINSSYTTVYDYGTSNYGNSANKINFTPSATGKYRFSFDIKDKTVTLYRVYDITYNKNDGTGTAPSDETVTAGSSVTIGTNSLSRTGYTASGWNTNDSGTGTNYANGASYTANADLTLYAKWTEKTSTFTVQAGSNGTITKSGTTSGVASYVTVSAVTPDTGYDFVGWQITGADASHVRIKNSSDTQVFDGSAWTSEANQKLTSIRVYSDGSSASMIATVTAVFAKAHYISIYNTTTYDRGHWVVLGSPPQEVKVTSPTGQVTTYTYVGGTREQRGEDQQSSGNSTDNTKTASGAYYEGNKLLIHTGDTIEMTYSALASSDIISGVFYNNSIRYTTELEADNLFCMRTYRDVGYGARDTGSGATYTSLVGGAAVPDDDVDYFYDANYSSMNGIYDGHALYANANYYADTTKTTITANANNYAATVDEDTHKVTWTAGDRDYLNIDIELASKKQVHFSDYANTVINSIHTDNYYAIGEDVSSGDAADTSLSIKAAGNADQTNTITMANVKFYYCNNMGEYINPATGRKVSKANRVELTGDDATLSAKGTATISNSGTTASSNFIYIDGPMPATDVMVDLDLVVSYSLTLRSKVMYDSASSNKKTAFGQVANLTMGSTTYTLNSSCTISTDCATGTYNAGQGVTLQVASITSGWIFTGWFTGTASGPDLDSEPLSTSKTYSYKPDHSGYIWAVGTKGLYIAGNRNLFKDDADWQFHEMEFDATLGTVGKYYWEIDETIFGGASSAYTCVDNGTTWHGTNGSDNTQNGYANSGSNYYWENNTDSYHGNAYFQFYDATNETASQTQTSNKTVWGNVLSFETEASNVRYGKVVRRGEDGDGDGQTSGSIRNKKGEGFIAFSESTYPGWSTPIRIYYDPASTGTFTVEPTGIYPHVYLSNGYKGLDVAKDGTPSAVTIKVNSGTPRSNDTNSTTYDDMVFNGNGWDPSNEGHVSDITVKARNATLTLTKATANANYKVSNFLVYNLAKNTVKAYPATATGNTYEYSCDTIKTSDDDSLYIMPILEYIGGNAKMTVVVDSSDLDYKQWGRLVACYAWNGSGDNNGPFPGQPMVPSDDGNSWKATFECASLTGITFSNYVNDVAGTTFLDTAGTMGTVSDEQQISGEATGGRINVYNHINSDDTKYNRTNFKAQTYDYREPIAYFNNRPAGATNTVLTFSLKTGNSKLLSWRDSELRSLNILTYKQAHPDWSDITFEYLTDSTGRKYADLNGYALPEKPTASFYIAAKAMVIYDDNVMTRVFSTGKYSNSNTVEAATYPDANYKDYKGYINDDLDMNFAVQWYIYDASGKFITTCLSAGFADKNATHQDMSVVTQRLRDLGYAVEGRSVKICYDIPRYCYTNSNNKPSSGDKFDVYRFTGQWYMDSQYKTANVYAKVGLKTDNEDLIADSSSAAYGSATVSVNSSKCSVAGHSGVDTEDGIDYGYTTIVDGDKGAITLTASPNNFIGWYHKNNEGELERDTRETSFTPSYSKDSTYIAMYEAKAIYRYNYRGREAERSYGVSTSIHLDEDEIANGNLVKTNNTHISDVVTRAPGAAVATVFKKTLTWPNPTTSNLSSTEEYILDVGGATLTPTDYTLTYKYKNASGEWVDTSKKTGAYNTRVDLIDENSGVSPAGQWTGHRFLGWYDSDNNLLSTQGNFGMNIVKDMTIHAKYDSESTVPSDDNWYVFIDDQGVTQEKYSTTTGIYYNDTIVRVRNNSQSIGGYVVLPDGAEVGVIVIDNNGGSNPAYDTLSLSQLQTIATKLSGHGSSGIISSTYGAEATKLCTTKDKVTNFGRVDLALRGSYANLNGHKYAIYAYVKIGSDYIFNTTPKTGTYS